MPLNMRGPVYNTVKMGKLHWRIQMPVFFLVVGGGGQTGLLLGRQFSEKKQQIAFDEVSRLAIKPLPQINILLCHRRLL